MDGPGKPAKHPWLSHCYQTGKADKASHRRSASHQKGLITRELYTACPTETRLKPRSAQTTMQESKQKSTKDTEREQRVAGHQKKTGMCINMYKGGGQGWVCDREATSAMEETIAGGPEGVARRTRKGKRERKGRKQEKGKKK